MEMHWRVKAAMPYFFNKTTSARLITFFPGLIGSGNITAPPFVASKALRNFFDYIWLKVCKRRS